MKLRRFLFNVAPAIFVALFLSIIIPSLLASRSDDVASAYAGLQAVSASVFRVAFGLSIETEPSITQNINPTHQRSMTVVGSTVTTGTSSPSGYTLYLQMTGENSITNSLINNIDTNATLTSSGSFDSPTTLSSGTWGYAIPHEASSVLSTNRFDDSYTEVESVSQTGSKFAAVPASNTSAEKIAATSGPSVVELPVYYGAMASYNTLSGSYSNKVLYTALADDGATPTMVVAPDRIAGSGNIPLTLVTSLYTTNEDFSYFAYMLTPDQYAAVEDGTLDVSTLTSQKLTSCSRDTSFDAFALNCRSVSLDHAGPTIIYLDIPAYDVHYNDQIMLAGTEDFYTISTMQEMTPAVCASVSTPAANADYAPTTYLTDSRDNKVYEVKKLADGNCWMTQNLALSDTTINYTDSNLPAGASYTVPESSTDGWCAAADESCINTANVLDANNAEYPEYGTYYSWKAATAGYGTYSTTSGNVSYSVCPKGWKLPTGGASGTFQGLYNKYNSASAMLSEAGPNFVLSGYRFGGNTLNQGSNGRYWSSTVYDAYGAYNLYLSSSGVNLADSNNKYVGFAVRCIADSFWNIANMQEMTSDTCAAANTPATTAINIDTDGTHSDDDSYVPQRTLYDIRDGETYTIRKLADGNCWMTENLKLQNTNLSSSDSDLPASTTFTVPASGENEFCTTSDSTNCDGRANVLDTGNASYGVYYNWFAATAGEGAYSKSSGDVSRSICPRGWRLPTGGSSGEFQGLYNAGYNTTAKMQSTDGTIGPGFVLSGYRNGGSTYDQGSSGNYWSSTVYNNYSAQRLDLGSSNVRPAGSDYKYLGFSVRCISR